MIEDLTILAPGLIGGSIAKAAHEKGLARNITVWARRPESRDSLRREPWVGRVAENIEDAVRDSTLVILAAPVDIIPQHATLISGRLPPGTLVTDVGSVKTDICDSCESILAPKAVFVGSHPMAGSEKTGWENGSPGLFEGCTTFITPTKDSPADAVQFLEAFWKSLGSRTVLAHPEEHDKIVAHISHLPQVLATTLVNTLAAEDPSWPAYSGGGLRDTTRIAAGDPNMWIPILRQNKEAILDTIRHYEGKLDSLKQALEKDDWECLEALFQKARDFRQSFPA